MLHPRVIQLIALVVCGGLICASAALVPALNQGRKSLNMYGSEDVLANAPPEYAFAIQAFGAFRSLIVNYAFIRAETYKQEGRYFDAMQLRSMICKLQPHFPSVWEFQAWDMSWNISVTTFTPHERWNWVYAGVKLLRDQGIQYNPRAVNLYKQLAWTFNNKMGENMDDFHWDYKREWAWRMHLVLGPRQAMIREYRPAEDFEPVVLDAADDPLVEMALAAAVRNEEKRRKRQAEEGVPFHTARPLEERLEDIPLGEEVGPDVQMTSEELTLRATYDYIQAIADAPQTLEELYRQSPEIREMVSQLREINVVITGEPLDEDSYWYKGKLAQTFFARYRKLVDTPGLRSEVTRRQQATPTPQQQALERLDEILGVRARNPAGQALLRFLQRKVLSEVYKLRPEQMASLVERFGPLDWREVNSQSLYWIAEGLERSGGTLSTFQSDKVNTARIIFFSLRSLFHRNRVTFEPNPDSIPESYINFAPDPSFVESMHRAYVTYGPLLDPDPGERGGAGQIFRTGHINFLQEAIRMLYFEDRIAEAEHYYKYLRTEYRLRPDGSVETRYSKPLYDFVIDTFYDDIEGPRETERAMADLLFRAYNDLADGDVESYNRLVAKAGQFREVYMKEKSYMQGPRMTPAELVNMQIDVFYEWFTVPPFDSSITLRKARLWRVAPPRLRQWVYDDLIRLLEYECGLWGFDVAKAFPQPPEMAAFREAHPGGRRAKRRVPTAETPAQPAGD